MFTKCSLKVYLQSTKYNDIKVYLHYAISARFLWHFFVTAQKYFFAKSTLSQLIPVAFLYFCTFVWSKENTKFLNIFKIHIFSSMLYNVKLMTSLFHSFSILHNFSSMHQCCLYIISETAALAIIKRQCQKSLLYCRGVSPYDWQAHTSFSSIMFIVIRYSATFLLHSVDKTSHTRTLLRLSGCSAESACQASTACCQHTPPSRLAICHVCHCDTESTSLLFLHIVLFGTLCFE